MTNTVMEFQMFQGRSDVMVRFSDARAHAVIECTFSVN